MLVECDSRAQRTFFRTFDLDSRRSKQFCPPLMESDWNDLVGRVIEIIPANDVQEMAEFDSTDRSATTRDFSVQDLLRSKIPANCFLARFSTSACVHAAYTPSTLDLTNVPFLRCMKKHSL